jgi:outer membrane protein
MKKITSVIALTLGLSCISMPGLSQDKSELKIGVVNVREVFKNVPQGQESLDELKSQSQPKISKLQEKRKNLQAKFKNLQKNKSAMAQSKVQKKRQNLLQKRQSIQKDFRRLQQKQRRNQQLLSQTFRMKLETALDNIGNKQNYDVILTNQAAPFAKNTYNITDRVIENMDSDKK